ncbi:unnamed protein product [Lactuca virosa]|uniref:Pentatricopeptide repeat-containing protein n=1 Tax=Lactuca virosa TaxID=75947 RepID=A0AAU9PAH1_9ASTR|nr:unnamed protein product [Lactuca virosa]
MVKHLTLTSPHIFNSLIDAFNKDMKVGYSNAIFGKMLKCGVTPSVVTYTILIDGYLREGNFDQSLKVFESMKLCNCPPNVYTFTIFIDALCQNGRMDEGLKLLETMRDTGVSPNVVTYTILIKAYVKSGELDHAFGILNDMVKDKCPPNFETFSSWLEGLVISISGKTKNKNASFTVFKEMNATHSVEFLQKAKKHGVKDSDVNSFLIMGLYKVGRIVEGYELAQEMVRNGYFPDITSCSQILEHLCHEGKYDDCVVWMKMMFDHGPMPSFESCCCLFHGLRKEGKIREMQDLMSDLLWKAGVEDKDGVLSYMESLLHCDEHDECLELLKVVEELNHQERPII